MLLLQEKFIEERLLHYVWLKGNFLPYEFATKYKEKIKIISPGEVNPAHEGADFLNACIEKNGIKIYGNIEIHLRSADWYAHKHHKHKIYNSCILHVVLFSDGQTILREDGTEIPEISLAPFINIKLLQSYEHFFVGKDILCGKWKDTIPQEILKNTLRRMFRERIEKRIRFFRALLRSNQGDWQQAAWEFLLFFAGSPYNKEAFWRLGTASPYKLLHYYKEKPLFQEALLLGIARKIPSRSEDDRSRKLAEIFSFLIKKHSLKLPEHLLFRHNGRTYNSPDFSLIRTLYLLRNFRDILEMMQALTPDFVLYLPEYWQMHLALARKTTRKISEHKSFLQKLLINAVFPFRIFYEKYTSGKEIFLQKAYSELPAENNKITRLVHKKTAFVLRSSYETQAVTELYKSYCSRKNCLKCPVGKYLLQKKS